MTTDNSDILGRYNLPEEIERLRPDAGRSGRRAESLVRTSQLRVLLVTMRTGAALDEHTAPGPITIHVLDGTMRVTVNREERTLGPGELIAIDARVPHAVNAESDGAFLLTINTMGASGSVPADTLEQGGTGD